MKEIICFSFKDGDPILYKEVDYNFSIGDTVYYELNEKEIQEVKSFYPHEDIEGIINDKWIDIGEMKIIWDVKVT